MSKWAGGIIRKTPVIPTSSAEDGVASGIWRISDLAYWRSTASWPSPVVPDPYFNYTTLLLRDSTLNSAQNNSFVDSSSFYTPITRNGNPTQGSFSPYGNNWSIYLDGAGDYIQTPASSATTLVGTMNSSTNLTIECWIYPTAYNNNSTNFPGLIGDMSPTTQVDYWSWGLTSTGTLMLYWYISGTQYRAYTTSTVSLNAWTHIALNISAGAITMYINGVSQALTGTSTLGAVSGSVGYLTVGQWNNGASSGDGGNYTGYVSNLRIVKASTYTTNFTPTSSPLTAITNTSFLSCQTNRFVDNSSSALAITRGGDTKVSNFGPFSPATTNNYNQNDISNWSNYFSGNGNYLSVADAAQFNLSNGSFTIEMWINPTGDYGNYNTLIAKRNGDTAATFAWEVFLYNGTGYLSFSNGINTYSSTTTPQAGVWSHVAAVYDGTNINLYLNGVRLLSSAMTNANNNTAAVQIGTYATYSERYIGYISNLRITKGAALYTGASFTVPTEPLTTTVSSGTVSLLTCKHPALSDSSTNQAVITPTGVVHITGFSPFAGTGYYSNYFDGTGDYLTATSNAAFAFGTGDFTIETWVYLTSYTTGNIFDTRAGDTATGIGGGLDNGVPAVYVKPTVYTFTGSTVPLNTWTHVAFVRSAGTMRAYVNGVGTSTNVVTADLTDTACRIGANINATPQCMSGYLSSTRIIKGTALYTSNFTPPTAPLTAISGTSLLTCQSSRFIDTSANAFAISRNGNTSVQSFNPFYTSSIASNGGSMYFDGSGDYLTTQSSAALSLGSGDFTVEAWIYPTGVSGTDSVIFDFRSGNSGNNGPLVIIGSGTNYLVYVAAGSARITGSAVTLNTWSHIAVCRSGTSTKMFLNGMQTGSTYTDTNSYTNPARVWIGADDDGSPNAYFIGYISNFRITKGTAVYTTNFTPPTAPVTPTAATTLLINGTNAGIYDQTGLNNFETTGDAKVSTSIKKYGSSSMYLDGTGDWLYRPANELNHFGSSNFTMEGWFYFTNANANALQTIYSNYTTWGAAHGTIYWGKHSSTSGYMSAWFSNYSTSTPLLAETSMPPSNTWTHYAIVRNGNTFTMYRNGTATASATYTGAATNGACPVFIGTNGDGTQYPFPGYIDDFRITRGIARYTANFTPPTSQFAAK